jgi:ribose transport system ATP-binding protein
MGQGQICLKMQDVTKHFGATTALEKVGFTLKVGQVHALVGENGAGKSTLMKILSGVIKPDKGNMDLFDEPYAPANPLDARKRGVAMIYQELSLVSHLSVEENVFIGMEPARMGFVKWKQLRRRTKEALEQLGHCEIDPSTKVADLSVGLQQVVEIARAIALGCKILVFDEPTSSLANEDVQKLFDVIGKLRDTGHGIVYISHFIEEIKEIADQYTVLRDGCFCGTGMVADVGVDQIVSLMVGRKIEDLYPRVERKPGDIAIEIKNLEGEKKPLNASLVLHYGEVLGIAGLVGSGKTEMVRGIFGLDKVVSGEIKVADLTGTLEPFERWKQGVGFLSENRKEEGLAASLSITDNVTLSKLDGYGPMGMVIPSRQHRATQKWINKLEIKCKSSKQLVEALSGGNQQKVALARLLEHDVNVLILDEPTRGIDVGSKALFYKIINELVQGNPEKGISPKAILMVSSYLPELLGVCDRIAVMCKGELKKARLAEELNEHQIMMEAVGVG